MEFHRVNEGDVVRSFDFEDRRDCYIEGIVEHIGQLPEFGYDCTRYVILVTKAVFGGEEVEFNPGSHVYPPANGTPTWLGNITNNVVPVEFIFESTHTQLSIGV